MLGQGCVLPTLRRTTTSRTGFDSVQPNKYFCHVHRHTEGQHVTICGYFNLAQQENVGHKMLCLKDYLNVTNLVQVSAQTVPGKSWGSNKSKLPLLLFTTITTNTSKTKPPPYTHHHRNHHHNHHPNQNYCYYHNCHHNHFITAITITVTTIINSKAASNSSQIPPFPV